MNRSLDVFLFLSAPFACAVAHAQIRTVALGSDLSALSIPRINNLGDTVWGTVNIVQGEIGGVLTTVAAANQPAPGTTATFSTFETASIDDARNVHFTARLAGTGIVFNVNDEGLWTDFGPTTSLIARLGNQAPGTATGVKFTSLQALDFGFGVARIASTGDGRTAFAGQVGGPGVTAANDVGFWSEANGTLQLVAREGAQAPGTATGVTFSRFFGDPQINAQGNSAFRGWLSGPGVDSSNFEGIWLGNSQGLSLVVRRGDPAPGSGAGAIIESPGAQPVANRANQVAFDGLIGGVAGHTYAIWDGSPGHLQLVTLDGQPVPGAPSVVTDRLFTPVINAKGAVAFRAGLTGTGVTSANDYSIWSNVGGQLRMVAREGNTPPGLPAGSKFGDLESSNTSMALNGAGELAIAGTYVSPDGSGGDAIWAQDKLGVLKLIARTGQTLETSPGTFKSIAYLFSDLEDTGLDDGRPSGFNERGQIAFYAGFTDGSSGVFISNAVLVPEPGAFILAAVGFAIVARWGVRRRNSMESSRLGRPLLPHLR